MSDLEALCAPCHEWRTAFDRFFGQTATPTARLVRFVNRSDCLTPSEMRSLRKKFGERAVVFDRSPKECDALFAWMAECSRLEAPMGRIFSGPIEREPEWPSVRDRQRLEATANAMRGALAFADEVEAPPLERGDLATSLRDEMRQICGEAPDLWRFLSDAHPELASRVGPPEALALVLA